MESEFIKSVKGSYYFISPYHKTKKKLPFVIVGSSYSDEFPVLVQTVEYKGWQRIDHSGSYSIESIRDMIESKLIIKYPNQ